MLAQGLPLSRRRRGEVAEYASQSRASGPILSERRSFRLGYWPALDGFRGVSILAVMVYHTGLLICGLLGSHKVFVLHGLLLPRLLLHQLPSTRPGVFP